MLVVSVSIPTSKCEFYLIPITGFPCLDFPRRSSNYEGKGGEAASRCSLGGRAGF